ncbi:MAG TPA: Gfo/Idh/MocA family oxidoreductase [Candidatus Acidoferrum sp.]
MTIDASATSTSARRLRLGMVGGGPGGFIGAVHRIAARIDDRYELVAAALSSNPERGRQAAADLHIPPDRAYGSFAEMAAAESKRPDRIDVVAIVTPNHLHFAPAKAFLDAGFHVICDKPLTTTVEDAQALSQIVKKSGLVFGLTHNYTGYPIIRQAREMVAAGELGKLRLVQVEYAQDWLTTPLENTGQKQAAWRTDPAQSGPAGSLGDIGTHAYNIACFVSQLHAEQVAADVSIMVPGRRLDDNVQVLLRYQEGVRGMLWASQVAVGNENNLRLRVYGEKGGIDWSQENPNYLHFSRYGKPTITLTRNGADATASAKHASRIPSGHPEGYLEAFAQIYTDIAEQISARLANRAPSKDSLLVPTVDDGVAGVQFIAAVLSSSKQNAAWVKLP